MSAFAGEGRRYCLPGGEIDVSWKLAGVSNWHHYEPVMMAGMAQPVTPVGGGGDWLTNDRAAFVADEVSSAGAEWALRWALANRERWPEMGRAAQRASRQNASLIRWEK